MTRHITMTTRAFSCDLRPVLHHIRVADDGTVLVYDSVAGHYTTCHSMSDGSMRAARAKVKNQPPDLTAGEFNRGE